MEIKANNTEPPHKIQRPNNNVITINTFNNGNSKIISINPSVCVVRKCFVLEEKYDFAARTGFRRVNVIVVVVVMTFAQLVLNGC